MISLPCAISFQSMPHITLKQKSKLTSKNGTQCPFIHGLVIEGIGDILQGWLGEVCIRPAWLVRPNTLLNRHEGLSLVRRHGYCLTDLNVKDTMQAPSVDWNRCSGLGNSTTLYITSPPLSVSMRVSAPLVLTDSGGEVKYNVVLGYYFNWSNTK